MGLLNLIQIPCHHVLGNKISLNLKYRIGLKHFFNINLGIGIIKKTTFFGLYFRHISQCFYSNFDRESSLDAKLTSTHSTLFWRTPLPHKQEIPEKTWWWCHHHIFKVFLVFGVVGYFKSMPSGHSLDAEFNSASNELSQSKFE